MNTFAGQTIAKLPEALLTVCQRINHAGGQAWLVGGCIRDRIMGIPANDYDLEVYGIQPDTLKTTLQRVGKTAWVGQHFGVFKLWVDQLEIDIAMPRSESKSGSGHRAFTISIDPFLTPEQASLRRDFTINAIMFNPLTEQLIDFHGGIKDIKNKTLKHISNAFSEDPLRPLRAMQFAARFQFQLAPETAALCKSMLAEAGSLSTERIWGEWQKWSHASYPSHGLQALRESGWLQIYPEIQAMIGCPQPARWHPEGDVWNHTLQVCDQAAQIASRAQLDQDTREQLLFAALCHDFGKPGCTTQNESGDFSSAGHSEAGIAPAKQFLHAIGAPDRLFRFIQPLILEHITHLHGQPTPRAVRRLAHRLEPANIELWEMLVEADASGRAPAPPSRPALIWLKQARALHHHQAAPQAIVNGKLLLKLAMAKPGPSMGKILKKAYAAQLEGAFHDTPSAIAWLETHTTENPPHERN